MRKKNDRRIHGKNKAVHVKRYTFIFALITSILMISAFCMTGVRGESKELSDSLLRLYGDIEDKEMVKKKEKTDQEEDQTQKEKTSQKDQPEEQPDSTQDQGTSQDGSQGTTQSKKQEGTSRDQDVKPDQPAASPDSYEIHLLLDSDQILDGNHLLKESILKQFDMDEDYKSFALAYYETPDRQFNQEGWINRIRMREDKPKKGFKITYKKRYSVSGDDLNGAMAQLEADGFDLTDQSWETQVEWNYSSMVLSISTEAESDTQGRKSMDELSLEDALAMLKTSMPAQEQNWKADLWGLQTLQSAQMGGPVRFKRFSGTYQGVDVDIEVWTIADQGSGTDRFITELSFKEKNYDKAAALRKELIESLGAQGILLARDGMKTQQILDIYFPVKN